MPGVHFDLAIRHRVVMRRLRGMTFVAIAQELRPMAVLSARRIWRQYLATGSAHPFARHRRRRRDSQLTWEDMDVWIARRVLAAPDLYVRELRQVFNQCHPGRNVSACAIAQALIVRFVLVYEFVAAGSVLVCFIRRPSFSFLSHYRSNA